MMIEDVDEVAIPTHSLVALTFDQFQPNEQPPELAYGGQQALLLRRIVSGSLADLTLAEVRVLITDNAPEESEIGQ